MMLYDVMSDVVVHPGFYFYYKQEQQWKGIPREGYPMGNYITTTSKTYTILLL